MGNGRALTCMGAILMSMAGAANASDAAAICGGPVIALAMLAGTLSWLFPIVAIAVAACAVALARGLRARVPGSGGPLALAGALALAAALYLGLVGVGVPIPEDAQTWVRWGRCQYPAGDLRALERILWLPALGLVGFALGWWTARTTTPPARARGRARMADSEPAQAASATLAAHSGTGADTAAVGRAARSAVEPVDAETRARIAAAVRRMAAPPADPPD